MSSLDTPGQVHNTKTTMAMVDFTNSGSKAWTPIATLGARHIDPMHLTIRETIKEFQKTSFEAFSLDITVLPIFETDSRRVTSSPGLGYRRSKRFQFSMSGLPARETMVKWGEDNSDILYIRLDKRHDRWVELTTFLERMSKATTTINDCSPSYRFSQQARWWHANGKAFHLLALPSELRNTIYTKFLGTQIEPRLLLPALNIARFWDKVPHVALLVANKQIHHEVRHILYKHTTFRYRSESIMNDMVLNPCAPFRHLAKIDLAFSHEYYLFFFGCKLVNRNAVKGLAICNGPSRAALALKTLPGLTCLNLVMPRPKDRSDFTPLVSGGCQKVVVKWILAAAWVHVKGLNVKVTGCVKTRQKEAFEKAAQRARRLRLYWEALGVVAWEREDGIEGEEDGGVGLGATASMVAGPGASESGGEKEGSAPEDPNGPIRDGAQGTVTMPPLCYCSTHCQNVQDWNPED